MRPPDPNPEAALRTLGSVLLFAMVACDGASHEAPLPGKATALPAMPGEQLGAPLPAFSEGQFPCTECHDPTLPNNPTRRTLEQAHQEIALHHAEDRLWCNDCHSPANRDKLHLASGELIDFADSHRLCGQCHGDKHRDWRAGVHGRRSGQWNGEKTYLLCAHCHAAHAPAFPAEKPLPPPNRPTPLGRGDHR